MPDKTDKTGKPDGSRRARFSIDWPTIIAVIGALAWLPWLYEVVRPVRLHGKVISRLENSGTFNGRPGVLHFLKLSLCASGKGYELESLSIRIKYAGELQPRVAKWQWARRSEWTMPEGTKMALRLPAEDFLGFRITLPKDEPVVTYLTFFTEGAALKDFDWVDLDLRNFSGDTRTVRIHRRAIDPEQLLFDDSIWTPIPGAT